MKDNFHLKTMQIISNAKDAATQMLLVDDPDLENLMTSDGSRDHDRSGT